MEDDGARGPAETTLVFLGDVVDRGPDSHGVVERLRELKRIMPSTRFLLGNHEEVFLAALNGDRRALKGFCRMGGRETILSYGIDEQAYERMDHDQLLDAIRMAVPVTDRQFLETFENFVVIGDYAFVHAGIDPAQPLAAQTGSSLRWIRAPFLEHRGRFEKMIVHGHTISHEAEWRPNRIGIDTGAYETGRLTALGLEGAERWTLQT